MNVSPLVRVLSTVAISLASFSDSAASSPDWPADGVPICAAVGSQERPSIVSDGAGGAIIFWSDLRDGFADIYAQRVLASGVVDPAWPADGRAVRVAPGHQVYPRATSDGQGGAIVTWEDQDLSTNTHRAFAQHILASGALDPAWPADGRALSSRPHQTFPQICSDGAGGAIISWEDFITNPDIYAQHVLASGLVDPAWPAAGRALCTTPDYQEYNVIVADGAGGAIVAWGDARNGTYDVYAQRVSAAGTLLPGWPADGRALCAADGDQRVIVICADDAGGAIVAWTDWRVPGSFSNISAQRVLASGTVDPGWPNDGLVVCATANYQQNPAIVADGAGGAILSWEDGRGGGSVYLQRVDSGGDIASGWLVDGRSVGASVGEYQPDLVSDAAGGAIVAWTSLKSSYADYDIYSQHVLESGGIDPSWPPHGRALCTAPRDQGLPIGVSIASDGAGGAIVAWQDERGGVDRDIYANRVFGPEQNLPPDCSNASASPSRVWPPNHNYHRIAILGVTDPDGDPVTIAVTGITQDEPLDSQVDGHRCEDARILGPEAEVRAERMGSRAESGNGRVYEVAFEASDGRGGTSAGKVQVCVPHDRSAPTCVDDGQQFVSTNACHAITQLPTTGEDGRLLLKTLEDRRSVIEFSLDSAGPVELALFDVAGRRVATLERDELPAGVHRRTMEKVGLSRGTYYLRLSQACGSTTRTVTVSP